MAFVAAVPRLCIVEFKRVLLVVTIAVAVIVIFQGFSVSYEQAFSFSRVHGRGSIVVVHGNLTVLQERESVANVVISPGLDKGNGNDTDDEVGDEDEEAEEANMDYDVVTVNPRHGQFMEEESDSSMNIEIKGNTSSYVRHKLDISAAGATGNPSKVSSLDDIDQNTKIDLKRPETLSLAIPRNSTLGGRLALKRLYVPAMSISEMNLLMMHNSVTSDLPLRRKKWSSARDQELLSVKLEIAKAPIKTNTHGLQSSIYQNISRFTRSYEFMERILKVYVYKEGEKPVFHQPKMRGIYAAEGWFLKLMEGNKKFVVRDQRKAHLFYLPFSSLMLRMAIDDRNFKNDRDLKKHLKNYIDIISHKYRFWNRTGGADHFLVACHDWATRITHPDITGKAIRSLCNSNAAKGFQIGKDTALPVTYIRSAAEPTRDIGGKPASERHILAFFAGSMHGYLRPVLLHFWENKQPDMKIFGSLPRDLDGKKSYREYMKSSKFCICARGYEVHTPRVVEAIFYECVPVIISDNYVPPFLEVLKWEEFAVFVKERDVPNLGKILRSISDEKYLKMHIGVKAVQRHFIWHKKPIKFDLFHMVLHSVWYQRILQLKPR